ncbi:MAG: hypothetical protein KDI98_06415 [Hyphomicrobiaceae bacterium]|nr:hypothetical protein [Hyphomicrobiaceae bacterium]
MSDVTGTYGMGTGAYEDASYFDSMANEVSVDTSAAANGAYNVGTQEIPHGPNTVIRADGRRGSRGAGVYPQLDPQTGKPVTQTHWSVDYHDGNKFLNGQGQPVPTQGAQYHWNQQSAHQQSGLYDHQLAKHAPLGETGAKVLYHAGKAAPAAARIAAPVAAVNDVNRIVNADNPALEAAATGAGWAAAGPGCKTLGTAGAVAFSETGPGAVVGGLGGCAIGGTVGYVAGYEAVQGTAQAAGQAVDAAADAVYYGSEELIFPGGRPY